MSILSADYLSDVKKLLSAASVCLSVRGDDEESIQRFLEHTERYLVQFELFKERYVAEDVFSTLEASEKQCLKEALVELSSVHEAVVASASGKKDFIQSKIGGIFKKASALKAYIDHLPSRITIAGKRKG